MAFAAREAIKEETQSQETAKLQEALRMMQIQIDEANAKVIKEREAARKAIEEAPPVVKETQSFEERLICSEMQSALHEWTSQRTVPNVFIGGKHIGGCDSTVALHQQGKLVPLLTEAKASGAAHMTPQRQRPSSASLFGRISQGLRASPQSVGLSFLNGRVLGRLDDVRQVEAKYPALLFKR